MAVCDMGHEHSEPASEPAPVAVEADPGPNENDVRIAEIDAAASIEREKLYTEQRGMELEADVQSLRGELRGMREVLDRLAPPEPEPIVPEPVMMPVPDPEPEPGPAAPPETEPRKDAGNKGGGWWGGYR